MVQDSPPPPPVHPVPAYWTALAFGARALLWFCLLGGMLHFAIKPYRFAPPRQPNHAALGADGLVFGAPGIARCNVDAGAMSLQQAHAQGPLRLDLDALSLPQSQEGTTPSTPFVQRLLSVPWQGAPLAAAPRSLSLSRQGNDLLLHARLAHGDGDGPLELRVKGALPAGERIRLTVEITGDELLVTGDGRSLASRAIGPNPLAGWDPQLELTLGNDQNGDRPWRGRLLRVQATLAGKITDCLEQRSLSLPQAVRQWHHPIEWVPLLPVRWRDGLENFLGFIPLGVMAAWSLAKHRNSAAWSIGVGSVLSLLIESSQLWMPTRYPSVNDWALNTLGTALGVWLGRHLGTLGQRSGLRGRDARGAR